MPILKNTETVPDIPIIDFEPFLTGNAQTKTEVGKKMVQVMKDVGFMYLINHGISSIMMEEAFEFSKMFFALSDDEKAKCAHPANGAHHRGWSALGKEKVVQMVFGEDEISELRKRPDVKESFDCGNENSMYCNFWPEEDAIHGFKGACIGYFKAFDDTSKLILRAIAIGMGLDEEFFLPYHSDSDNQLRLLHYPPTKQEDLQNGKAERIAAHTDFGTLTMLLQDECGGLEVENPHSPGSFISAPFIKDSLIVNIGDFLMRWSNDQLKSTLHRVRSPPKDSETGISKVRYSIPFFVSCNKDVIIDCLPGTFSESEPKRYKPINSLDYLSMRLNATY
ncbi:uncharacterized protein PRCAT00002455001 [Priceomyces carsonii]|uniref:uncharacterized protein n=1 Tax=Priceomyces carsonii TaxID=28549 RepID=UPI002EDB1886|nr:unnamed protein product [Priceomyces carsonii]